MNAVMNTRTTQYKGQGVHWRVVRVSVGTSPGTVGWLVRTR